MKESMGLVPTLSIIIFAVVLLSGYLSFTINYSKAYKANSKIVNIIQKHENDVEDKSTIEEIEKYLESINYNASTEYTEKCPDEGYTVSTGSTNKSWCYKIISTSDGSERESDMIRKYVKVRTYMSIDVPLLNKILPNLNISKVNGSTKPVMVEVK
ncbi:MAG: hypothetical protein ILA19_03635 [Bacilli bacterium]|nr:hypothetical protein [Bacilli bacterium]